MLGRFGYDCPAVGFAFDVGRALSVMAAQGVEVALAGPDFFIIDFTREKTAALSLARRLRDRGASVSRDIVSRALTESLAYARAHRARVALVVGGERTAPGEVLVIDLATGTERVLAVTAVLEQPEHYFAIDSERRS
jgi:histidyl-tRNA synthetase